MPWFKVDDNLALHAKVAAAGNAAMGLWVRAGSWCSHQLQDGFVPDHIVSMLGKPAEARKLVDVGLWSRIDGGYLFHQWDERQPLRAEVEVQREWDKKRMELHRDKDLVAAIRHRDGDRCRYCGRQVRWSARRGPDAATYDHVTPRGDNSLENVVVACGPCNSRKGARTPQAAGMRLLAPGSVGLISVGSKNGSSSDQDPVPSRPDPALEEQGETGDEQSPTGTDARSRPRAHSGGDCPDHPGEPAARCGRCAATAKPMPADFRNQRGGRAS